MAKGKFSQPRRPRRDLDDTYAAYQPPAPEPEPRKKPVTRRVTNASRAETIVVKDGFFPEGVPYPQEEPAQDVPSFEEVQFLNETAVPAPTDDAQDEEYDEDYEYERRGSRSQKNQTRKVLIISICAVAVLLLIAIIAGVVLFLNANADDGLILNNVTIAGVNVGGMTPEQAAAAVHRATDLTYTNENMVIRLPDTTLELSPADTGVKLDVNAAVQAAYDYGRSGTKEENKKAQAASQISNHTIALLPYLNLNQNYIRQVLDEYGEDFNSTYEDSSFEFQGEKPALDGENFDKSAPCQTLILNPGSPGRNLDIDKIYNAVLDAYSMNEFLVEAEMSAPEELPEMLDLDAIFEEYCSEPSDASMDMETFEVTPETYGYTFDLERAKELLSETPYGTPIGIPMEYVIPEILGENLDGKLFRDVLASYETPHTSDENRNNNLKLACAAINGTVLMPGDTFDYNTALGERTEAAGYKPAGALNAGTSITEVGGGICQVSSTLYYCTLMADLEIVTRRSHSLVSSYIPIGMDATVSWGGPDFRFRNNTDFPVRIDAEVSGGYVKISLMGTDEKDYYVEMTATTVEVLKPETKYEEYTPENLPSGYYDGMTKQNGFTGYTVYTYKCKYDKQTNELISKEYEATSNYVKKDTIIIKVIQPETEPETEPETNPPATEAPTTPPATEAPAENSSESESAVSGDSAA